MTQQILGMVKERLINCSTRFDNDQIDAVMEIVEKSGYSEIYEALSDLALCFRNIEILSSIQDEFEKDALKTAIDTMTKVLAKVEGREE